MAAAVTDRGGKVVLEEAGGKPGQFFESFAAKPASRRGARRKHDLAGEAKAGAGGPARVTFAGGHEH